jgi:hypothetical protein
LVFFVCHNYPYFKFALIQIAPYPFIIRRRTPNPSKVLNTPKSEQIVIGILTNAVATDRDMKMRASFGILRPIGWGEGARRADEGGWAKPKVIPMIFVPFRGYSFV